MKKTLLVVATALLASGCGDDGTSFSGIYSITTWTENEGSCSSEGDSILEDRSQTHILVRNNEIFGQEFVEALPCASLAECQEAAGEEDTINLSAFIFEGGDDESGWTGEGYAIGGIDTCSGEVWADRLTGDEMTVRVERRGTAVENVPLDSDDSCDGDAAEEQAASSSCTRLEVISATLVESL